MLGLLGEFKYIEKSMSWLRSNMGKSSWCGLCGAGTLAGMLVICGVDWLISSMPVPCMSCPYGVGVKDQRPGENDVIALSRKHSHDPPIAWACSPSWKDGGSENPPRLLTASPKPEASQGWMGLLERRSRLLDLPPARDAPSILSGKAEV